LGEEVFTIASVKKFTDHAVPNQLRHIARAVVHPSNVDIDASRSSLNRRLAPDRGMSPYDYYKTRKSELYCYNRKDVKTMAGWVVTVPADLPDTEHDRFFDAVYAFLSGRYGESNVVDAIVHKDEAGSPHLHFCFIPVVPDNKHGGEKICANDLLNPKELQRFHPLLQKHLDSLGIGAGVCTGVTAARGGNITVDELKNKRNRDWEQNRNRNWNHERNSEYTDSRWYTNDNTIIYYKET